jgi:hypothetical protein
MKSFIASLVIFFALASGVSLMSLTGQDLARIDQNGAHMASHQKAALLY